MRFTASFGLILLAVLIAGGVDPSTELSITRMGVVLAFVVMGVLVGLLPAPDSRSRSMARKVGSPWHLR